MRDASGGFGDEDAIGGRFEVDSAGLVLDNDLLEVCRWVRAPEGEKEVPSAGGGSVASPAVATGLGQNREDFEFERNFG